MNRLHYLDHLRAFAMLTGVFVHVTTLAHFGWLEFFATASDHFRMGTFFAVSGFFAGMILARRSVGTFLVSRLQNLGIPLMFGLFILNPVTLLMIYNWRGGSAGLGQLGELILLSFGPQSEVQGHFVWHLHLWFLVSLLCYSCVAPLVFRV
ncbi:MAG: acyltransferase family protein [Paracoccaceae bacterium]